MAGRGPAPKDPAERRRRNTTPPPTELETDGELVGPDLPELGEDQEWPDATLDWWDTWRASPQAKEFTKTDWSFLLDTAFLHMQFWDGNLKVAAELRLRAAKFGATPEDRMRLRLSIKDPSPTPATPTATNRKKSPAARTRKERVLKVVGENQ